MFTIVSPIEIEAVVSRFFPVIEHKSEFYPTWLKKNFYRSWNKFNEYEKAALYVLHAKKISKKNNNIFKIYYDDIIDNPFECLNCGSWGKKPWLCICLLIDETNLI